MGPKVFFLPPHGEHVPPVWKIAQGTPRPCRGTGPHTGSPSYPGVDDQVGADTHLFQIRIPLLPMPILHLVGMVQVIQGGFRDVYPPGERLGQRASSSTPEPSA